MRHQEAPNSSDYILLRFKNSFRTMCPMADTINWFTRIDWQLTEEDRTVSYWCADGRFGSVYHLCYRQKIEVDERLVSRGSQRNLRL